MVELILGTYGVLCWLVLIKFKLLPLNAYTIFSAIAGGGRARVGEGHRVEADLAHRPVRRSRADGHRPPDQVLQGWA